MKSTACAIVLLVLCAACGHRKDVLPTVSPSSSSSSTFERYARIVSDQAARNHVPAALVGAIIIVESGGNPHAAGAGGSRGLMQLKPATAAHYGVTDLDDPVANITAGARYLHDLLTRFNGSLTLAVAAYQAGAGAVARAAGIPAGAGAYVQRVMQTYNALLRASEGRY